MAKKRSRKRRRRPPASAASAQTAAAQAPEPAPAPPRRNARSRGPGGPPPPPWGSFPLSELVVLVAIPLLIAGFFVGPPQGAYMLGVGLALGAFAGLELALREHLAGYRSHTLLLSGAPALGTLTLLVAVTDLPPVLCGVAAALVMAGVVYLLAGAFRRRSGGALYKIRGD